MLVLSRKVGERIVIGDNITLVVNRIEGNRVSLGIQAPNHVRIVRGELSRFDVSDDAQLPAPITFQTDVTGFAPRIAR